jgi:Methyltransferase domain
MPHDKNQTENFPICLKDLDLARGNTDSGSWPLDIIGIREGTDKNSLTGDYLRHYERVFSDLREEEFNFIEIGVFRGASARTWERFFSRASIVGVDIDPTCRRFATDRVRIEIGSQNDPEFLNHLATRYPPRVVIDDGSHQSYDIIFTFERLFPALQPGGIYIIEDLHFHLLEGEAERLRGESPILACDYVMSLAKDRLGSEAYIRQQRGLRRYLLNSIDRIEIIGQAAIFHKKAITSPLEATLLLRPHIEAANDWFMWLTFSQKMMQAGADDQLVADGLRRSIALHADALVTYERLSETLERLGDIPGAIGTLEQALKLPSRKPESAAILQGRIQRLQSKRPV